MKIYIRKDMFLCESCAKALGYVESIRMTAGTYFVCDTCNRHTHADAEQPKHDKPTPQAHRR